MEALTGQPDAPDTGEDADGGGDVPPGVPQDAEDGRDVSGTGPDVPEPGEDVADADVTSERAAA